jgi:FecR protein
MPKRRTAFWLFSAAVASFCAAPLSAFAAGADQIGLAVVVKNNVSRVEPTVARIAEGDAMIRDEVIQTQTDSHAKFVLKDSTNLMLGPNSRLKLDKAVFADEHGVGDVAIKLGVGSFRFMTGNMAKESYSITTPVATMGVRGTTLEFLNEISKSTIALKDGQAEVCAGGRCVQLLRAGDTAIVTKNGVRTDIELQPFSTWSFACEGMCSPLTFAQAETDVTGSVGAGGGGGGGGGINNPPPTGGSFAGSSPSNTPGTQNSTVGLFGGAPGLGGFGPASTSPF